MSETVLSVKTLTDFQAILQKHAKVAVDFSAEWCGPCKVIGPKFKDLAGRYTDIKFVKIDVDENAETAEKYQVKAMPTFTFFKQGDEQTALGLVGASEDKLKASLDKLKAL